MFLFDSAFMLAVIFFANILPGMLLALGLLKNSKELGLVEKLLIGATLGFILPGIAPFLLSFIGVSFSYGLALASVALMYVFAIAAIALSYRNESLAGMLKLEGLKLEPLPVALSALLIVLLFFSFTMRLSAISPIYMELDPYFYSYGAMYIVEDGSVPVRDSTAWWPENSSSHRAIPALIYLESMWYSAYTHGAAGTADSYLVAQISNFYPPIAATLTVFFVYLMFRMGFNRETGLAIAALLSFMPSYLYKTLSGVYEAQPMSFLLYAAALALAYAFLKTKDRGILAVLALLYAPLILGSTGGGLMPIMLSTAITAMVVLNFAGHKMGGYGDERHAKDNETYLWLSGALLLSYFLSAVLQDLYQDGLLGFGSISYLGINAMPFLLSLAMKMVYNSKERMEMFRKNENAVYAGAIVLVALFLISPFGSSVLDYARTGFSSGSYNTVLERTIAEHQLSGASLSSDLSALGGTIDIPVIREIIAIASAIVNVIYTIAVDIINAVFGLYIPAISKDPSIAAVAMLGFMGLTVYEISKFLKSREIPILFMLVAVMFYPLSVPGMVQEKFSVYFTFIFIVMIGYMFGRIYGALGERLKDFRLDKNGSALPMKAIAYAALFLLLVSPVVFSSFSMKMASASLSPKFGDNPHAFDSKAAALCTLSGGSGDFCAYSSSPDAYLSRVDNQYSFSMCYYTLMYDSIMNDKDDPEMSNVASLRCSQISSGWMTALEWMKTGIPEDGRITSWWDYGHWTNFFARRASVIRNEHASVPMIQDVAHALIMANESETIEIMRKYHSEYLLVDSEIILGSGSVFGAKFYALNYLACSRDNLTNVLMSQMESQCEYDNLWEEIVPTSEPCLISPISQKYGVVAKKRAITSENGIAKKSSYVSAYCIGSVTLANGQVMNGTYYLDRKTPAGELALNRALPEATGSGTYVLVYTKNPVWLVDGNVTSGWEDRKGRFYDSAVYKGFVLGELDGFDMVYNNGYIKIYKISG
jgi:asparagine N-glycosylation enzyme membrane subunit Stt3